MFLESRAAPQLAELLIMHLYNLSLLTPTSMTQAVVGAFSSTTKEQQIAVCRGGTLLELLQVDKTTGKIVSLLKHNAFGVIRSLASFRLTGGTKGTY